MKKFVLIMMLLITSLTIMADDVGPYAPGEWTWTEHNTWDICEYADVYDEPGSKSSYYDGFYNINTDVTINIKSFGFDEGDRAYVGFDFISDDGRDLDKTFLYQVDQRDVRSNNWTLDQGYYIGPDGTASITLESGDMVGLIAKANTPNTNRIDWLMGEDDAFGPLGWFGTSPVSDNEWYTTDNGRTFTWYANTDHTKGFVLSVSGAPLPSSVATLLITLVVISAGVGFKKLKRYECAI